MKLQVWLCFIVLGWQQLPAQDSLLRKTTEQYALDYMKVASTHTAIFSGKQQQPMVQVLLNHQYFKKAAYVSGKLSYNGIVYPNVALRWDLYRDELVLLSPANYNIALTSENMDFAEMYGYHIVYLHPDSLNGCPPAGNYIRLYSGNDYLLLEKLTNDLFIMGKNAQREYQYYFVLSTNFYLQKNGVYYKITNRKALLKSLGTHRKELRRFIRANNLHYRVDDEKMVLETVKKHEKLSHYE